jgi:NADH dehydrogenase
VPDAQGAVEVQQGDLRDARAARALLDGRDVLVHLAPGLRARDDPEDVIVSGTETLLAAAKDANLGRVVFVSPLGAQAANHFPLYAAEWKAEQLVRGSGLPYVILRPSLVLGAGDGVTAPLAAFMRASPVVPVPGNGMHRLQPIDVQDLVRCILHSLDDDGVLNEEISVGGPMYLTTRQLVDLVGGAIGIHRRKVRVPAAWLASAGGRLPGGAELFTPARVAQLDTESASSPGIVESVFGFEPRSIVPLLESYLAAGTLA